MHGDDRVGALLERGHAVMRAGKLQNFRPAEQRAKPSARGFGGKVGGDQVGHAGPIQEASEEKQQGQQHEDRQCDGRGKEHVGEEAGHAHPAMGGDAAKLGVNPGGFGGSSPSPSETEPNKDAAA